MKKSSPERENLTWKIGCAEKRGRAMATTGAHRKAEAPVVIRGCTWVLNDACQFNANKPLGHIKRKFEVRVTSEGEGIEPSG
jgi:hypothetical protein